MNSAHLHNSHPCSHPHAADRFIIVCQESAGFTFQQNGGIWWANRCTRTPSIATLATTCQIGSTPLPLTPPFQPTCRPTQAQPDSGCGYMFLSQASCQILFHFMFFFFLSRRNGGRTGHSDNLNHSVCILNVLRAKWASRNRCSANVLSL